jgi:hypothetical protein
MFLALPLAVPDGLSVHMHSRCESVLLGYLGAEEEALDVTKVTPPSFYLLYDTSSTIRLPPRTSHVARLSPAKDDDATTTTNDDHGLAPN